MRKTPINPSVFALLFCFSITQIATGTSYFFSGTGNWTDVARWSPSYPGEDIASGDAITINGTCTLDNNVTLNGSLVIFGGGKDLIIPIGFTMTISVGGQLINQSQGGTFELGGILDITGYMRINNGETLTILNTGELKLNAGNDPNVQMHGSIINDGKITMNDGILENAVFNTANDGLVNNNLFQGEGTISGTGAASEITNAASGNFTPGSSPGCISAAGMTNNGTMSIEVNGITPCIQFDQITSTGTIVLNGILATSFAFTPDISTTITIIDANIISGTFSSVSPALPSGWEIQYNMPNTGEVSLIFSVLPVELISFAALPEEKSISLNWKTASESNNEKFEVEESQDGQEFLKIGEVKGKGTTLEQQDYYFKVKNPKNGISYYRLKQIDYDGRFEYSYVVSVNYKGASKEIGAFYPNPSNSGLVNLDYSTQDNDEIKFDVFDMTGMMVTSQIKQVSDGINQLTFDFSDLDIGVYIVKIGNESNPTRRKLVIKK